MGHLFGSLPFENRFRPNPAGSASIENAPAIPEAFVQNNHLSGETICPDYRSSPSGSRKVSERSPRGFITCTVTADFFITEAGSRNRTRWFT